VKKFLNWLRNLLNLAKDKGLIDKKPDVLPKGPTDTFGR